MSINSINHDDMSNIAHKWDYDNMPDDVQPNKQVKSTEARRRIEMLKDIRDSGLTMEEARELGLIH
ncbi:hypothetical protein RCJ22_21690 [Vibrio sp. FNV 38]|nr:hypothetical protein [Vibrio sp. FNV 38]